MKYRTVIFDFDGTIADSMQAVLDVVNACAGEFGYEPVTHEEIPRLRTMSARELLVERLHVPLWNVWKMYRLEKRGRELFAGKADAISIFPGMKEVIAQLKGAGYRVGIVSSNSPDIVTGVLRATGIDVDFIHAGSPIFGKARAIRNALKASDVDRATVAYVGDEVRDVDACKKVGIDMLAVGWGYNAPEVLQKSGTTVAATPEELLRMLS